MPLQDKKPLPPPASTSLDLLTLIIPIPGMMRVTDLSSWYTNLLFKTAAEEGVNNCKQGSFSFTNAFFSFWISPPSRMMKHVVLSSSGRGTCWLLFDKAVYLFAFYPQEEEAPVCFVVVKLKIPQGQMR